MKKIVKNLTFILTACCLFMMFSMTQVKAYSISYGDFRPIDPQENKHVKNTIIGHWNNGGFFETVTRQKIGSDPNTGNELYRFRYYITHRGDGASYIYQKVPVGLYIDGVKRAQYMNGGRYSNRTALWGELVTTLEPGNHVVELRDEYGGAITQVNVRWDINIDVPRYTVTFLDYNGTLLKREIVNKGGNATPPPSPSLAGHIFKGWQGDYTNVRSDRTIIAQYDLNRYLVEFESNGGTAVSPQTVAHGGKVVIPVNPIRGDDKFMGWYIDVGLRNKYDFNTLVLSNVKLYAKWDKKPTINANDMTIFANSYTVDEWRKVKNENATAIDQEDGDITRNITVIMDNVNLGVVGKYDVVYQIVDSANNLVKKPIKVTVIDGIPEDEKVGKYIRSINKKYVDTLKPTSIWKTDKSLNKILLETLNKSDEAEPKFIWELKKEDILAIKEFNRLYGYSKESNEEFYRRFGHLQKK